VTKAELYRQVFNAPGGKDVLADLATLVKHMPSEDTGAGKILAHIQQQLYLSDPPDAKKRPDRMKASGGRIAHG
jgi:hypothetical protein